MVEIKSYFDVIFILKWVCVCINKYKVFYRKMCQTWFKLANVFARTPLHFIL